MSITVDVGLLSGRTATFEAGLEEEVEALRCRAHAALGIRKGRLVDKSGIVLDTRAKVKDARVQNGDALTLQVSRVQVCATAEAFAAILGDGSVVTWGDTRRGADSSLLQERLRNVQQIHANDHSFAAILGRWICLDLG